MTNRRAAIFVNGKVEDYAALKSWLRETDYLVCADGGAVHCLAIGRRPDLIVGDLDSLDPHLIRQLSAQDVQFERHPRTKDQTDLELAIERALRDGVSEIMLVGALGGRLDQTMANLLILAQREWPVPVFLVEGNQIAQIMRGPASLLLRAPIGSTVSALPLSTQVSGISYTGLRYPLEMATLALGSTRGISNEVVELPASIRIDAGLLLVVQSVER